MSGGANICWCAVVLRVQKVNLHTSGAGRPWLCEEACKSGVHGMRSVQHFP